MKKDKDTSKRRDFVTTNEAAEMLGVSYYTVYEYIRENRLVAERVGGIYMIPEKAVKEFKAKPTGRTRVKPPPWRVYRAGAKVRAMDIRVQVRAGERLRLIEKLNAMQERQEHLFPGTMQRYVFEDEAVPTMVTISLIWKDTEMPDEAMVQQEFVAFKGELGDVLDWETAQYSIKRAIIHT
jgi:excisionase family DNA binding protein